MRKKNERNKLTIFFLFIIPLNTDHLFNLLLLLLLFSFTYLLVNHSING
jgi:hypothetical protein